MNVVSPQWLPLGFHEWLPAAQAATLGLLTFVQEDAAVAAVLAKWVRAATAEWERRQIGRAHV